MGIKSRLSNAVARAFYGAGYLIGSSLAGKAAPEPEPAWFDIIELPREHRGAFWLACRADKMPTHDAVAALARFSTRLLKALDVLAQHRRRLLCEVKTLEGTLETKRELEVKVEEWHDKELASWRKALEAERDAYGKEWDQAREQSTTWHNLAVKLERERDAWREKARRVDELEMSLGLVQAEAKEWRERAVDAEAGKETVQHERDEYYAELELLRGQAAGTVARVERRYYGVDVYVDGHAHAYVAKSELDKVQGRRDACEEQIENIAASLGLMCEWTSAHQHEHCIQNAIEALQTRVDGAEILATNLKAEKTDALSLLDRTDLLVGIREVIDENHRLVQENNRQSASANEVAGATKLNQVATDLVDAIAIPAGRDFERAWDDACLFFGRYGAEPVLLAKSIEKAVKERDDALAAAEGRGRRAAEGRKLTLKARFKKETIMSDSKTYKDLDISVALGGLGMLAMTQKEDIGALQTLLASDAQLPPNIRLALTFFCTTHALRDVLLFAAGRVLDLPLDKRNEVLDCIQQLRVYGRPGAPHPTHEEAAAFAIETTRTLGFAFFDRDLTAEEVAMLKAHLASVREQGGGG